jgi:hypothetical protein
MIVQTGKANQRKKNHAKKEKKEKLKNNTKECITGCGTTNSIKVLSCNHSSKDVHATL